MTTIYMIEYQRNQDTDIETWFHAGYFFTFEAAAAKVEELKVQTLAREVRDAEQYYRSLHAKWELAYKKWALLSEHQMTTENAPVEPVLETFTRFLGTDPNYCHLFSITEVEAGISYSG